MFVKICGIAQESDAKAVAALSPDAMGFIFHPKSPRAVTPEQVREWTRALPSSLLKVGVFVNETAARINQVVKQAGLDVAQLHGQEGPETCELVSVVTWKAINPRDFPKPEALSDYRVDAFVLDSGTPSAPGGTGRKLDWGSLGSFVDRLRAPVVLAGGLTPANVRDAIRAMTPWGVDVASGVELAPGRKDLEAVRKFIQNARGG